MVKPYKIQLAGKNSWEDGYKSFFKNPTLEEIINELCGSIDSSKKFILKIDEYKKNIRVMNNVLGISSGDVQRLDKFSSGNIQTENKKGDSERGVGTRCVFRALSQDELPDQEITDEFLSTIINKYSFLISKISEDINEKKFTGKKGDYLLYCYDKVNKYFFYNINKTSFMDEFKDLFDDINTIFICPYENKKLLEESSLKHNIRKIFNRCDCDIILNNENITDTKQYKLFDDKLFDETISHKIKYLEFKLKVLNYKNTKIATLEIIKIKGTSDIDESIYYDFKGGRSGTKMKFISDNDWIYNDTVDETKCNTEYECIIRLQSKIDNDEYYSYYNNKTGENNGILPYVNKKCLRYNYPNKRMKNNNSRPWMQGIPNDRPSTKDYSRTIGDEKTTYQNGQNWQSEIEEYLNYSDCETLFIKEVEKFNSEIKCDKECKKEYHKIIPFFINYLIKKYIWIEKNKTKIEDTDTRAIRAEKKAKKEEAAKLKAEKKAKEEEAAKLKAEKKAKKEEAAKLKAEKKAKEEEAAKLKAEKKAKEEEAAKLKAEKKAKEEEELKHEAEHNAEEEREYKNRALEKLEECEDKILEKDELLNGNNISQCAPTGFHIYGLYDPTRPKYRKTGKTTKNKEELRKQYSTRYFPDGINIIAFISFEDQKGMEGAEKHLQNNMTKKYRKYCGNYGTEWLKFPQDWSKEEIDEYVIEKIKQLTKD